jgi:hypothetical protein
MFYLYLLFFAGIMYYRKFLIVKIFKLFIILMKWKIENLNSIKKHSFKQIGSDIIGKYVIKEYDVVHNNKNHNIIFGNDCCESDFCTEIKDFVSNIDEYLLNKNMIVHCSITDKDNDIILDTTREFRKFCYYYEHKLAL